MAEVMDLHLTSEDLILPLQGLLISERIPYPYFHASQIGIYVASREKTHRFQLRPRMRSSTLKEQYERP